jgi:hypothetical protein
MSSSEMVQKMQMDVQLTNDGQDRVPNTASEIKAGRKREIRYRRNKV